ncbi:homeobox protein HOX3 [Caerostris darwini]|uniref:Homeobox protein HOX3 n=1 Tax=Caerostris darwini TaxID=1538125 RepID=A0AAV4U4J0_9ARAC|nr:homeobox protein HOX3 [Caerostris darwini]
MPFETTLSPYVNKNSCCISISPALVSEDYNEGDIMKYNHPQTTDQVGEDSQNALDIDVNIKNDNETKLEDEDKFLILPRNFYQEGNCPTSVPVSVPYSSFNSGKLFTPYQGRIQSNLSMLPFSSHCEEESPRSGKSPSFEPSHYVDYNDDKLKDASCEEQDQKIFLPAEESNDAFVNKPIYPWMVDARHNTKNRQQQIFDGDKGHFNQYMALSSVDGIAIAFGRPSITQS